MQKISFAQFLAEREKMFQVQQYAVGQSPAKTMAKGIAKPASPAKTIAPFQGIHVADIFGKPKRGPSNVLGK